ncbi:MAG: hypothetical protein P4N60_09865 [Verrucomicrobiae bacterium]|nr:hypothetical protein [Verrucomicrobiae bacterium]
MRAFPTNLFSPKVEVFNPDHSFRVSGVTRWRLCRILAGLPGVTFTRKPRLLGSGALPYAEFQFRGLRFQVADGGDTGGDGLWIEPQDGLAHPVELRALREQAEKLVLPKCT